MNWTDFAIGAFLMNAMPHLVLGIWNGRILSAFGFGNKQNIAYGFLCLAISVGLYIYKYGFAGLLNNGIYSGALAILLIYFIAGKLVYKYFNKK
jgi:uncharacterized protein (DUF2235 family)